MIMGKYFNFQEKRKDYLNKKNHKKIFYHKFSIFRFDEKFIHKLRIKEYGHYTKHPKKFQKFMFWGKVVNSNFYKKFIKLWKGPLYYKK